MSKISQDAARAFEKSQPFKRGNTEVRTAELFDTLTGVFLGLEVQLFLHGNLIAWDGPFGRFVTCAGWPTQTTKSRLNALAGVEIKTVKGRLMLNSHPWEGGQSPV
jgi:hypothetical protein